jgi:outer membrane protein
MKPSLARQHGLIRCGAILCLWIAVPFTAASQEKPGALVGETAAEASKAPLVITLQDALARAKANDPQFRSAVTDLGVAHQDVVQSRAGLLPNVSYNMQYIYSQTNPGTLTTPPAARYVANNGQHEYIAQGDVHQALSAGMLAQHRAVEAAEALARAKSEIAARGLVVTVVQAYDGYVVAQRKYATAQKATAEAGRFLDISQKLEAGGEVANSDVIKAKIQAQQQERNLQDARLAMNKSRLDLAVLLFPNFEENFMVVDDLRLPDPLPAFGEVQAAAMKNNPDIRAALASVRESDQQVKVAWTAMLPSLTADYFYGIDANQFAVHGPGPERMRNLGYSAVAGLQLPIFNWGSGYSKVKQADLRRRQAHIELSAAQRQLLANLRSYYEEAEIGRAELESLNQSAELAADSVRLTTLRYQAGESSVLEVVDAQNTLTQARDAFDEGQLRFQVAMANLQTLTGNF